MNYRITISLPCYKRPERTIRAIESVLAQTVDGYELLITGDDCPEFKEADYVQRIYEICSIVPGLRNSIRFKNNPKHGGFWGTDIRNKHILAAQGEWFMFMGSDDVLLPNHLENILAGVEGTDLDFAYFDTYVEPNDAPRNAQLKHGMIGHSELIVRSSFLKTMPAHKPIYGHDFDLVQHMLLKTDKFKKLSGLPQTYIVKSVTGKTEQGID